MADSLHEALNATADAVTVADQVKAQLTSLNGTALISAQQYVTAAVLASLANTSDDALAGQRQAAALLMLSAVASSGPVGADVAANATAALSVVATKAANNTDAGTLQAVTGILGALALGQAASLLASLANTGSLPAPAVVNTAAIKTLVQVDPPGSNRLSTQPLTVPGAASAFEPMPAGLLAGVTTPIVTQFFALAFDPYTSSAADNVSTSGGVTRLAFSAPDGSAIEVANASTPIRFTLPGVDAAAGAQAACVYWDVATGAYSSGGCVGVPSPAPPGHTLYFLANFTAATDADLVNAWQIDGPLVAGCNVSVLDCNADEPGVVWPDPRDALRVPAIACPPRGTVAGANGGEPVLRVFWGTYCALWRTDNAANCSWNALNQTFAGSGCVASTGPTRCMCRQCVARCVLVQRLLTFLRSTA